MKRFALLVFGAAIVAALVVYLRLRPGKPPPVAAGPEAKLPLDPDRPGVAPGPEAREQESAATEDTRLDRLADREREERREAARHLQADPLTEKPSGDEPEEA